MYAIRSYYGEHAYEPIGFVDDHSYTKGLTIHDIPILGTSEMLSSIIERNNFV